MWKNYIENMDGIRAIKANNEINENLTFKIEDFLKKENIDIV